ncbi:hypothetical protein OG298_40750 [Streptomyces sp. NBC_01005]|uniref:hypothetical protein n=1 Tax=unclassified Streptomyces TaxID=2593676 RepID=UPI00386C998D|nr:hypothetical protein OG298_40750 [Streptomyces sp. NBC_01005]WTC99688.1 hypothetical protein OH736_40765 [Streptomyces sp. NBC_01650]
MPTLIGFRALRGLGAGGIAVGAFVLIGALLSLRGRDRYQGLTATVVALGTIGGLLGGVIAGHLNWRWDFCIAIPLGLVAFARSAWAISLLAVEKRNPRINCAGILVTAAVIAAAVLVATWGGSAYAWGSPRISCLSTGAVVALAMFVAIERRAVEPGLTLGSRRLLVGIHLALLGVGAALFDAVVDRGGAEQRGAEEQGCRVLHDHLVSHARPVLRRGGVTTPTCSARWAWWPARSWPCVARTTRSLPPFGRAYAAPCPTCFEPIPRAGHLAIQVQTAVFTALDDFFTSISA